MNYRVCSFCIMDNRSDSTIIFDDNGQCDYCKNALNEIGQVYFPNEKGKIKLLNMIETIKNAGKNKKYDCIMGISGGLDSSYLAYLGYKWGLRILAVHIDDGFDTDISKNNIHKLCQAANIELKTIVPDSYQYNQLIKAYLKAGVPNVAIPQDNILFAFLYDEIRLNNIKYFLSGGNFALECILQRGNTYNSMDTLNIKDINNKFGNTSIDKLKFISSYKKYLMLKTKKLIEYRPLNYIDYNRDRAFKELNQFCGFEYYGRKHLENILTAFIQLYWLPKKFGVDKRTSHLSSMIVSGQLSRDKALEELNKPMYDKELMDEYISIIKCNLDISDAEFIEIMEAPTHQHTDYKTDKLANFIRKFAK